MGASWSGEGFQVMLPAECQVVPEPSRSRSSNTTSPRPRSARCHAMLVPITPPPMTKFRIGPPLIARAHLSAFGDVQDNELRVERTRQVAIELRDRSFEGAERPA